MPVYPNVTEPSGNVYIGLISLWCELEAICFVQTGDMSSFQILPHENKKMHPPSSGHSSPPPPHPPTSLSKIGLNFRPNLPR